MLLSPRLPRNLWRLARHEVRHRVRELFLLPRSLRFRLSGWLLRRKFFYLAHFASPGIRGNTRLRKIHETDGAFVQAHQLLAGKSVAIVGPCVGPDQESEINNYELVARISHDIKSEYPLGSGTRCEVSYYAGWKLIQMEDAGSLVASLRGLKLVVVRDRKLISKMIGTEFSQRLSEARRTGLDHRFFPVKPNAIPQLVSFLLSCGASRVKIFNVDLFTGPYSNSYAKRSLHEKNVSDESLVMHNPFTHLKYFRLLMLDPRVSMDNTLEGVLRKSPREYARALRDRP